MKPSGVSYVIGYILVFGMMVTILFTTTTIVYTRVETSYLNALQYLFDSIANQMVDAIVDAQKIGEAYPDAYFERKIELPQTRYEYYIDVTNSTVYINSTKLNIRRDFGANIVHGIPVSGYVIGGNLEYIRVVYYANEIEVTT
jgi:hypothetical protein